MSDELGPVDMDEIRMRALVQGLREAAAGKYGQEFGETLDKLLEIQHRWKREPGRPVTAEAFSELAFATFYGLLTLMMVLTGQDARESQQQPESSAEDSEG